MEEVVRLGRRCRRDEGDRTVIELPLCAIRASPNVGEHSEEILLEIGLSWDEIIELKLQDLVL